MRTRALLVSVCAVTSLFARSNGAASPPVAPVRPVLDDYFGNKITDQYRYMEDLKNPEVQNWVKAQNDYTRTVLDAIPGHRELLARVRELDQSVPRVFASHLPGNVYIIRKRLPKEDLEKLYLRQGLNGEDRLLVDPEKVKIAASNAGKGKSTIQYAEISRDLTYVAVGIAPGGAERDTEIHVFETATGRDTGDLIPRAWFGGSAGGILIGRAIMDRPDLFGAAIDIVGCSDALRMETTSNGVPNIPEFGSTKTEGGYKALYEMSSYHHIKDQVAYPAVLFETGWNDPRVDPWQMAKMTARMQAASSSGKPALLRVEYEGGHGDIGGTEKQAQERLADEFTFLLLQFGIPEFQPQRKP